MARVSATCRSRASSIATGDRRRRTVRDEPGLDAGHHDRRPLPTLGAVEREQLDTERFLLVERVGRGDPRTQRRRRRPPGCSRRNSSTAAATRRSASSVRRRRACRGPTPGDGSPTAARSPSARAWPSGVPGPRRPWRIGTPAAWSDLGQADELVVGAGQHGDGAGADGAGVERAHERGDERRLVGLVVGGDDPHGGAVRPRRHGGAGRVAGAQHVHRRRRRSAACSDGSSGGGSPRPRAGGRRCPTAASGSEPLNP